MTEAIKLIFLRAGIAILAAGVGGVLGILGRKASHKTLCGMVSFAAGALLSVTMLHIVPEAAEIIGWGKALATTLAGALVFYLIGQYVSYLCPACAATASEEHHGYLRLGVLLMVALAIHSTVDGLAIAAGWETTPLVAYLVLFAVSYHKVPEGLALASIARLAGFTRARALGLTVLIELTTGLGAFLGIFALQTLSSIWLGITLGVVGGSFLYVVGFALIREMMEHERRSIIIYLILGFVSIIIVGQLLEASGIGHAH